MVVFHSLTQDTRAVLRANGLDPDSVAALIRHALAEDLMGGVDVTSVATIPADQRSTATFGSREVGVVSGLGVAAAVIEIVCGEQASK
ncbi:MAG: nicotinate-nucleotide diphosphorylase (carboxylating), partial [Actinobacteria bacterium]